MTRGSKIDPVVIIECRRLRTEERLSTHAIAKVSGISIATLSVALRDIPLTKMELSAISSAGSKRRIYSKRIKNVRLDEFAHLSTIEKGKLAEIYFEGECVRHRIECAKPIFDCRYDYIARIDGKFNRIQIKWADGGRAIGNIIVPFQSVQPRRTKNIVTSYSSDDIDLIIAYTPFLKKFLKFEKEIFENKKWISLRIEPTSGKRKRVNIIDDFIWVT